jgi:acetoin utilization protein AcuB
MRVQDMMTRRVQTITGAEPVSAAVERMRRSRIRHLVVMRDGELAGIVSSGDMRALDLRRDRRVEEIMTAPAVTATPGMTMRKAANLLRGRSIGCLPVVEDGSLVGIVTTSDLLERIGRGVERPVSRGKRWILKGRGPRRKSVVGRKDFAGR